MLNRVWSVFLLVLLLSGCGWSGTPTRHNDISPPTSIEVVTNSSVIAALTSTKLTVIGNYDGKYTLDLTDQAVWSTDSPAVADFSTASPNRVVAHAPGTANLTATVRGVSKTFQLTVSSATITALTITPAAPTIAAGFDQQFAVSGTFSDSTVQDVTLDSTWASDTPGVATISNAAASKGFAHALAVGTSTISATFGGMSGTTVLTVSAPVALSVAMESFDTTVGTSKTFSVKARMSDGSNPDVTANSEWSSSNAAIATVGNVAPDKGKVTGVAAGSATISAVYAGFTATGNVTVAEKVVKSLAITPPPNTFDTTSSPFAFKTSAPAQFTATATYNDDSTEVVTTKATWTSNLPNSASVDKGLVTPISSNRVTITATFGGLNQTVTVVVQ